MIVADTSALITIASIDLLDTVLTEFDIHTTTTVLEELEETSAYDDRHGTAARSVLEQRHRITVHSTDGTARQSSRIDRGEASTIELATQESADFVITDDLRALPELQAAVQATVAISPIVLSALVERDALETETAVEKLEQAAANRDWLGAPIYRRARELLE
ncbi:hypothetical protein [Natronobiforma cellulositropha]|uniref:hypothetical protein n=1 Tax=Natronobiforma cellulositropha TaxID=1679076 RepID=UPI0021D5DFF9|nr:hypothetical protein [Natronobiforma cellulositropha]